MMFLIDRCAGRKVQLWLASEGHDAVHVADLGPDPGDAALLLIAATQRRVLITIDSDFGTLIFRDSEAHAGVVRLPDVPPEQRIEILRQLIATHAGDLEARAVITVRDGRIRIALPPTGGA